MTVSGLGSGAGCGAKGQSASRPRAARKMAEFNLATHQSAILKDLGNKMLREGKPEEAMVKYGEAIAAFQREGLHEGMAVCLVNRSIVNAKLSRWPESYCDAKLACSLFPRCLRWTPCASSL